MTVNQNFKDTISINRDKLVAAGFSGKTLNAYLANKRAPRYITVLAIAEICSIKIDSFFSNKGK